MLPQRRLILGLFGLFTLCLGMALFFCLPPQTLVQSLRERGITTASTVTGVDNKPKYVEVRFMQGSDKGTVVRLSDYAGMLPDTRPGELLLVTYDPNDPSRSLAHSWVTDPPANVPAYGMFALTGFFLLGTVGVALRRRWILRTPWPPDPFAPDTADSHQPVRLTKP
ncbi:hypothetical protein N4P33_07980 [Streptomyces sp. 15-116A]|uniref:DUF3592 domain-containing protein n=1 Tax=Streptomyces sp. 15-116A TaxID=2259035 RepID=UPI0021B3A4F0|nr:DUF3592 domain-containing protein [Streptomyces sp. 15-116A]MCT7352112.1 hypothetical protein [Streptomyces sp. 15-116A]